MRYFLLAVAVVLHIFFYISALKTHTLDYFFSWGNVHDHQGIDFYQVPNGARSYFRGGLLTGNGNDFGYGNYNVYHPFFTIVVGGFFQLFQPIFSFKLWIFLHEIIYFALAGYLYLRFRTNKNIYFALLLFLGFFPHYLEIWNGQYHVLLNVAVFFLLLASLRKSEKISDALAYLLSLLVKPIALLYAPALILKKRWKTLLIGAIGFAVVTIPFYLNGDGQYYISNLLERIKTPISGPPGNFTLDSLLRFWNIPFYQSMSAKISIALLLLFIQWRCRLNLLQALFLWTSYYLLFYDLVFEYHYTTLAPFLAIGVLTQKALQSLFAKILSLSYIFPTPFFLFHFFQFQAVGWRVTDFGWTILVLFRILPLIILNFVIIFTQLSNNLFNEQNKIR